MAVRIKDIADALGLSNATVSMVINNKPGVSPETRKKVMKMLVESGYRAHLLSKAPIPGEEIAFIVCKKHGRVVGDTPFFARIIEEMEHACRDAGHTLSITYLNFLSSVSINEQLSRISPGAKGLLILATELEREDMAIFERLNLPTVAIDSALTGAEVDKVCINNFEGAFKATEYLIGKGHTRIGHMESKDWIKNFDERRAGYLSAMKHAGLTPLEEDTVSLRANTEEACIDMEAAIARRQSLPTAFFADNDTIALGAMRALKRAGLRIPEDVSVIGFDDIPSCTVIEPPLTTMRVECDCIGHVSVCRLLELIKNEGGRAYRLKQDVDTRLIERESVRTAAERPRDSRVNSTLYL